MTEKAIKKSRIEELVTQGKEAQSKAYKNGIVVSVEEEQRLLTITEELDVLMGLKKAEGVV